MPRLQTHANPTTPSRRQRPLGARHLALPPRDPRNRRPDGDGRGLEGALGPVVVVLAAQAVDVHGDAGGLGEALEGVGDHLGAEVADALAAEAEFDDGVGPVRDVDDGAGEGLVEGAVGVAEAGDADGGAEGRVEGGAEGYADVFGGVVVVDWDAVLVREGGEPEGREERGGGEEGPYCGGHPCR